MCWSHWCEYELGEATIFNFIFHLSLVRAYFEEVHSEAIYEKICLAQNNFKQLMELVEKLCQT